MATIQAQGAAAPSEPPSAEAAIPPPGQHIPMVQKLTLVSWGDGPAPPYPVPDDGESTVSTAVFSSQILVGHAAVSS